MTATASSGLTVAYTASPSSVCQVSSGSIVSILAAGTCTVTATQSGRARGELGTASVIDRDAIALKLKHPVCGQLGMRSPHGCNNHGHAAIDQRAAIGHTANARVFALGAA